MYKVGDKVKVSGGDHNGCVGQVKEVFPGGMYKVTVDNAPAGIPATIVFLEKDLSKA